MSFSDIVSDVEKGLVEKRDVIEHWREAVPETEQETVLGPAGEEGLRAHLHVVDTSLQQAEHGTLGVCVVCHGRVDEELLQMDYTACVCLDHFSPAERRQLENELELSQIVQRGLLPQSMPYIDGLELAAFSRPSQIIGGDYFDFLQFKDGAPGLVMADISGHGVSAGMLMSSLQTAFRTLVPEAVGPAEILERINRLYIHNINFTTFVTVFFARFDPSSRRLTYSSAGHNPAILYRKAADGIQRLQRTGAAIGLIDGSPLGTEAVTLSQGDRLLLYTDGVTEATNSRGEQFGEHRLAEVVSRDHDLPAEALVQSIRLALGEFTEGVVPEDDTTLVVAALT
jgi:sigma-B regulation protein RsbU (phosphoserine phosphatase)